MTTRVQILIFAALACVLVQHAAAQSASDQVDNPRIITSREYLLSKGIGVSRESLALALHSKTPRIRISAASVLGQEHPDEQSIRWIKDALNSERDPLTKVYLATVLIELDMPEGTKFLTQTCSDNAQTAAVVREATKFLVQAGGGHECIDTVLDKLKDPQASDVDIGYLVQLLGQLYHKATDSQGVEILSVLKKNLEHSSVEVRASASRSVWIAGAPDSPAILRAVLEKEKDPTVKDELETDLANLARGVK